MHFKETNQKTLQGIYIILILMLCYGLYKNGISYVFIGKENFWDVLRLLLYPILAVSFHIITNLFQKKNLFLNLYKGLFLGLLVPPTFPVWIFILLLIIYSFIQIIHLKLPISKELFFKILLILASLIFSISYENQIESSTPYLYGTIDLFLGRSVGNFGTTCILLLLMLYIVLSTDFYYKKELPIYAICGFFLPAFFYGIIDPNYEFLRGILNSHFWVTIIVFLPINEYSPVLKKGKIGYGLLMGFASFFLIEILKLIDGPYFILTIMQFLFVLSRKLWFQKETIVYAKKV